MRKYLLPAILTGVMLSSGVAMAATTDGIVKTWDAKTHTLILQDGKSYILPVSFSASDAFKAGEKVKISYDVKDGKNMATTAAMAS